MPTTPGPTVTREWHMMAERTHSRGCAACNAGECAWGDCPDCVPGTLCPLHAAAPAMLEVIRTMALTGLSDASPDERQAMLARAIQDARTLLRSLEG